MRREILMPALPPSTNGGKIARWHVSEGQAVAAGDVLAEIATPTATLEIEAENEGHVERILVPAGTEGVKVNTPIAILFGAARAPGPRPASLSAAMTFASFGTETTGPNEAAGTCDDEQTYREALRDALAEEMRRDPAVFLIGTDVAQNRGAHKVAQGLLDEFGPGRVVAVPPVEEALLGTAVGAAFAGLKPVVEILSWGRSLEALGPFLAAASETFYLSGGTLPVPIVIRGPNGFVPGMSGQESRCVASLLAQIPGLKVVQPATPSTAKSLLKAAIRDPGPVAVLEHELLYAGRGAIEPDGDAMAEIGKARIVCDGADVTIAAAGRAVVTALEAAGHLRAEGIEAEVIDLMSVRPLDVAAVVRSVARTGRLVTVEEGWSMGGLGAELAAAVGSELFGRLKSAPLRIAGADVPMPYAADLQAAAVPDAARVFEAVLDLVHPR